MNQNQHKRLGELKIKFKLILGKRLWNLFLSFISYEPLKHMRGFYYPCLLFDLTSRN